MSPVSGETTRPLPSVDEIRAALKCTDLKHVTFHGEVVGTFTLDVESCACVGEWRGVEVNVSADSIPEFRTRLAKIIRRILKGRS